MAFIHVLLTVIYAFIFREDDILPYGVVRDHPFSVDGASVRTVCFPREDDILPYRFEGNSAVRTDGTPHRCVRIFVAPMYTHSEMYKTGCQFVGEDIILPFLRCGLMVYFGRM